MNSKPTPRRSRGPSVATHLVTPYMKAVVGVLMFMILANVPASAVLGDSEASVTSDSIRMKSEDHVQKFNGYQAHELTSAHGPTVREYVSPQGTVFGVTWQGTSVPDMNQLLGPYFNRLQNATPEETRIQRRRGITVTTKDFVYSNFCHMRACTGRAYVPSLLPSNVSAGVMR
jgi:hypothetical protein